LTMIIMMMMTLTGGICQKPPRPTDWGTGAVAHKKPEAT